LLTRLHHVELVLFRHFLRLIADAPKFSNRRLGKETVLVAAAARGNGVIVELTAWLDNDAVPKFANRIGVVHLCLDEAAVILFQFWLIAAGPL